MSSQLMSPQHVNVEVDWERHLGQQFQQISDVDCVGEYGPGHTDVEMEAEMEDDGEGEDGKDVDFV